MGAGEGGVGMDKSSVDAGRFARWSEASQARAAYPVGRSSVKRAMDLIFVLPVLVFTSPLLMLIYALIKFLDPGPALFKQLRVGRDGQQFIVYKFRTMRVDAEDRLQQVLKSDPRKAAEWAKYQKLRNDPRVTVLGRFLRKSSLDELPQLLNILRMCRF